MVAKILAGIAALVFFVIALGFVLPDKKHVEREIVVNAPPERVYELVADFHNWRRWSPWEERDPTMTSAITGSGVGQTMEWVSEKDGAGSQEIVRLEPPRKVETRLDFGHMGVARSTMRLEPVAEGTRVVWSFDSKMREGAPVWWQPLLTYMGFFIEHYVGRDYEEGLVRLKAAAEKGA